MGSITTDLPPPSKRKRTLEHRLHPGFLLCTEERALVVDLVARRTNLVVTGLDVAVLAAIEKNDAGQRTKVDRTVDLQRAVSRRRPSNRHARTRPQVAARRAAKSPSSLALPTLLLSTSWSSQMGIRRTCGRPEGRRPSGTACADCGTPRGRCTGRPVIPYGAGRSRLVDVVAEKYDEIESRLGHVAMAGVKPDCQFCMRRT